MGEVVDNQEIANTLYAIADLLDIKGDNFFKIRAYRMAAQIIEGMDQSAQQLMQEEQLRDIKGIGKAIAQKIEELVQTGKLSYLEELKQEVPEALLRLLAINGLGPKKVAALYKERGITTIDELKKAAEQGKLRDLEGFGEITEMKIIRGIQLLRQTSGRYLLHLAYENGTKYLSYMKKCSDLNKVELAGSLRRMKETIGDIDLLAASNKPEKVMDYFVNYTDVDEILLQGKTKTSVRLNDHMQVDLRVVEQKSFGAALQYFTGSKEHNVTLRGIAIKQGYKLNEYGLFTKDDDEYVMGESEPKLYDHLGLDYIEPELRENNGEFEAAENHELPTLLTLKDIKGDLHVHSTWSDGNDSLDDMIKRAQHLGYDYVASTDHSQSLKVAHGLTEERVKKKIQTIEKLNKKLNDFTVLAGTECDIKPDGSLDYPNHILKQFDIVFLGIHTGFSMDPKQITKRITNALSNDHVHVLAHPTCRMIGRREPLPIDMNALFETAKNTNTMLEVNSFPDRLDLNALHIRQAIDHDVTLVINTDSHSTRHLPYMRYGVATARKGWAEAGHIANTYSLNKLRSLLERKG